MRLKEYEDRQVKLDKYFYYMIEKITKSLGKLTIEELEHMMERLDIYNKYKEEK